MEKPLAPTALAELMNLRNKISEMSDISEGTYLSGHSLLRRMETDWMSREASPKSNKIALRKYFFWWMNDVVFCLFRCFWTTEFVSRIVWIIGVNPQHCFWTSWNKNKSSLKSRPFWKTICHSLCKNTISCVCFLAIFCRCKTIPNKMVLLGTTIPEQAMQES